MPTPAINSAFDAANWFLKKSESEGFYLEPEKLQHLIFLAQMHYSLPNDGNYLFPSLFICDHSGFVEPTLQKALSFGRPLMEIPEFSEPINNFLDLIWQKYSPLSIKALADFIKKTSGYTKHYQSGRRNIVDVSNIAFEFKDNLRNESFNQSKGNAPKKILISQNGPVVVSQWSPRKLSLKNSKKTKE